ncbi:hypothetical protein M406DRAFT_64339 [Cryphonectria parasitica EP155]|uniref:SEC7 domain-containing protein n=1 Tax=Cryphonectria parasitica (strain ATCC 38755 / EP155) TaxID=660469 RepID=A0A9P5CMM1_CRYP1|nr:uncharacterized protein M406DRAFT_64339 [Cryphonectria parasitica EP155]KAF3763221.1 hypothetical protein M406DRAFT_64339 [Cryphonectria parasitica EP155]
MRAQDLGTTPPCGDGTPAPRRHSHDLSLSPRNVTRDSLLGNMLLSLDQFNHMSQVNNMQTSGETRTMSGFAGPHPSYRYEDPAAAGPRAGTAGAVAGGRGGHGYSYSSDYEGADDDLSRVSTNMSRGRRSNSLSANPAAPRPCVDAAGYAHVLGSQKWAQSIGVPKRSSSLEPARRRSYGTQPPDQQQLHSSNLDYDYSYDLDDAAPTPTVPVGPRRLATMPSMPSIARHEPMGEPLSPRSNKSSRSTSTAKHHPSSSSRRDAARERDHEPVPPLPLPGTAPGTVADLLEDSAPAPHVGYEKAKEPVHASPAAAPTSTVAQHKEKQPGFFRRINHASSSQQSPTTANAAFSEANKAATSTPSSRQTSSSHGIQKKPSGFFRRRKKSVSVNNVEPPPLPPTLPPSIIPSAELLPPPQKRLEVMTPKPEPSPVTSLRKAMDPFLKASESSAPSSGRTSPRDDQAQSVYHSAVEEFPPDRQLRSFSPDYEPDPRATIRSVPSDSRPRDSMASEKSDRPGSLTLPIEGFKTEPEPEPELKTRASAASIPDLKIEGADLNATTNLPKAEHPLDEPHFIVGDPTQDDKAKAQKIFDGSEDFIPKEKAASWMGEEGPIRQRTLRAYMDLYDFTNKNIVTSLRDVCNRLILRAETQQVDRILVTFSKRWCDCNPHHGFKSVDVIHTICYSIMLLNTDLHMADIESKMTRSQFIKNTMTTVRQAVAESIPNAYDRPSILPGKGSTLDDRRHFRNSFIKLPGRAGSALGDAPTELDDCGPLVKSPFEGSLKAWESQMEVVLKDIYASIRDERLPLYGAEPVQELPSAGGLSVMGMLKRSPSVLSKAPSENPSARGRVGPESIRAGNGRWSSKSRSRPRGFGSAGFASSRTSFDDGQSLWSPVDSVATWSRASLGRTHTSMSMDSFGSRFPRGDYQQSIGFANALSQAIIREDPRSSVPSLVSDDLKTTQLLDDESLELAGPPWVKEGIVIHKHHLDGVDKKAKDRNWTEVFAVIQKGNISIFSFTPNKSMGRRSRNAPKKGAVVGGGNWQENATTLGTWSLRLTLASALPPPGYSKQRPHVWALSLPTGAVHLFHVGTPEICNEFVTTANYWSARLSTHPLIGGVSNMEFGWSDAIINNALVSAINETTGPAGRQRSSSNAAARSSMHSRGSSFRSLPGDIVNIAEWTPPTQSMRPSNASEKDQLDALLNYVKSIEEELQQHNALRSPMLLAFTPRGSNAQKAMANWERKSSYLLREIVKFRTYVDILQLADTRRTEIYRELSTWTGSVPTWVRASVPTSLEVRTVPNTKGDGG